MIYCTTYEHGGNTYSLQIYGSQLEANTHCDNLGLTEPELLAENIGFECEIHTDMRVN